MKKMNAFIAAMALALAAVTPLASSAAEHTNVKSVPMDVSKTYDTSYTLHLPDETPEITDAEKAVDVKFGVTAYLEYNQKLTVNVKSLNGWNLKDTAVGSEALVDYKLKAGEKDLTGEDSNFMYVTDFDNTEAVYTQLTFCEFGTPTYAGTYKDTLTFSVSVDKMKDSDERDTAEAQTLSRKAAEEEARKAEEEAKKAAEEAALTTTEEVTTAAEETTTTVVSEEITPAVSSETSSTPTVDPVE